MAARTDAVARLLTARGGRRSFVPLARSFVQRRETGGGPGPLAAFVRTRRRRALDLYLLVHASASREPWDVALRSRQWTALLGMPDSPGSRVFVSNTISWLERERLVQTERDKALRRIVLLDESGAGTPYRHPATARKPDYFKLPFAYWTEGWADELAFAGIVALLIALSLPPTFALPYEHGAQWYGLSRDTVRRGVHDLLDHDLLTLYPRFKRAPNAPAGVTEDRYYSLRGSFAPEVRRSQRPGARSRPGVQSEEQV